MSREREMDELLKQAVAVMNTIQWRSAHKDNMEFAATITYSQMDKIKSIVTKLDAALAQPQLRDPPEGAAGIGDQVMKIGSYRIPGEVRSVFTMSNGCVRYVVEHKAEGGGSFLHIYSAANLAPPPSPSEPKEDKSR